TAFTPGLLQRIDDLEPGPHRPRGIVFMSLRMSEVDQEAIAEILRDISVETTNDRSADGLIAPHNSAPLFRIEPRRQRRRPDDIAEHHGELTALSLAASL